MSWDHTDAMVRAKAAEALIDQLPAPLVWREWFAEDGPEAEWETEPDQGLAVIAITLHRTSAPDGVLHDEYLWDVTVSEQIIVGPYPGSPDSTETVVGDGTASTLNEAKWQAIRAWERAKIADLAYGWEGTEFYAHDPECPDEDWWKAR